MKKVVIKISIENLIENINMFEVNSFVSVDYKKPVLKLPSQIQTLARTITDGIEEPTVKAYAIYDWVVKNVSYNKIANENFHDECAIVYSLKNKAGTCYSMARLYVALAKSVDLDARIAKVIVDCDGKEMGSPGHVCAMVDFVKGHLYFDPAYKNGDAKHKNVKHFSREETNNELIEDILNPYRAVLKLFEEKEDYKKQSECCDRALYLFPENEFFKLKKEAVLNKVGLKNIERGFPKTAVVCFKQIIKMDPSNITAKKNLELAQIMDGGKK